MGRLGTKIELLISLASRDQQVAYDRNTLLLARTQQISAAKWSWALPTVEDQKAAEKEAAQKAAEQKRKEEE